MGSGKVTLHKTSETRDIVAATFGNYNMSLRNFKKNPMNPKRGREKEKEALKSETSSTMWGDIEKSKYVIITVPENSLNSLKDKDCQSKTQINKAP